jgi:hypothetical protein
MNRLKERHQKSKEPYNERENVEGSQQELPDLLGEKQVEQFANLIHPNATIHQLF